MWYVTLFIKNPATGKVIPTDAQEFNGTLEEVFSEMSSGFKPLAHGLIIDSVIIARG